MWDHIRHSPKALHLVSVLSPEEVDAVRGQKESGQVAATARGKERTSDRSLDSGKLSNSSPEKNSPFKRSLMRVDTSETTDV